MKRGLQRKPCQTMGNHELLFLYSEIMPYNVAVFKALINNYDVSINVIHWDKKKLTPYAPPEMPNVRFYNNSEFDKETLLAFALKTKPSILYVSGRMDAKYLYVAKHLKKYVPVVSGMDTQWDSSLRKYTACALSRFLFHRYFTHIWVPGCYQYEYARRLGFKRNRIISELYCCNVEIFHSYYQQCKATKKFSFPHSFLFVGRLDNVKYVAELCSSFISIKTESIAKDWKLHIVGDGLLRKSIPLHEDIYVHPFMDHNSLGNLIKETGVFCLPSRMEPWGVVVHEFAAAGMPLLLSDSVGAVNKFLIPNYNGFIFRAGDLMDLKFKMINFMHQGNETLNEMGRRSYELSQRITPATSAAKLMSLAT